MRDCYSNTTKQNQNQNAFEYKRTLLLKSTINKNRKRWGRGRGRRASSFKALPRFTRTLRCNHPQLISLHDKIKAFHEFIYSREGTAATAIIDHNISCDRRTQRPTFLLNSSFLSLHSFCQYKQVLIIYKAHKEKNSMVHRAT